MKRTRRLLLCLVGLCGLLTGARAQWIPLSPMIAATDTVSSVHMIRSSGGKLFICTDKGLFVSYDDGDTWINLTYGKANTGERRILSIYYDSFVDKLYAGGDSAVFASTDNGATWSLTAVKSVNRVNDISKAGFNVIVSYGIPGYPSGGIYYSEDDMSTYKEATIPSAPVFGFETGGAMAFAGSRDGAYVSTDYGLTWTLSGSGHPGGARYGPLVRHHGSIYAGDINGHGLWRSSDEGNTWKEVNSTVFKNFCQVLDMVSGNKAIVLIAEGACNVDGPVKLSADSGKTWINPPGLPLGLYSRLGRNTTGDCFYIFEQNTRILYRNCNPKLDVAHTAAALTGIYPNPVTTLLHVEGWRNAEARLIDINGKEVYRREFREEEIQLDMSGLQPGAYFLVLQSGASRVTRTVIRQ